MRNKKLIIIAFLGNIKYDARCLNMAETLCKTNFDVIVLDEQSNDHYISKSFKIQHINTKFKKGIKRYWNYHCIAQQISKDFNPDIFITADLFALAVCAKQNKKCVKIFDSRELYSKLAALVNKPLAQFFWSLYEKIFYKSMDRIIVTAESDKMYLINRYGGKEIEMIYNFPQIPNSNSNMDIRKRFNITSNTKIFIYQGAIQAGRGIDVMIKLLTKFPQCVAFIVGEGDYKIQLEQYAIELKVNDRIFFIGAIPYKELLSITEQADLGFSLIQPISQSYEQALPNKLFEYGLAGIPTIASDFPELKQYTIDFNLGLVVNPTDFEAQIKTVNELLTWDNKEELSNTVKQNFTWESQTNKFLSLMENFK